MNKVNKSFKIYSAGFHFLTEGQMDWRNVPGELPGPVDGLERGCVEKFTLNGSQVAGAQCHTRGSRLWEEKLVEPMPSRGGGGSRSPASSMFILKPC